MGEILLSVNTKCLVLPFDQLPKYLFLQLHLNMADFFPLPSYENNIFAWLLSNPESMLTTYARN